MKTQHQPQTQQRTYAENFQIRLSEIEGECAPHRAGNVARADNLFRAKITSAAQAFRVSLKHRPGEVATWSATFPDKSSLDLFPGHRALPVLRKVLS
jgi:hypothetical protein